jgi:hypothetical protein
MADIDQIIASGAKTNADFDFSKINKSYWEGQDQYAKNQLRDAFKGGVPTLPDGSLDISSVMKTLFQKGDIAGGVGLAGAAAGAADRAELGRVDSPQAQATPAANLGPPSANRSIPISGNAPVRAALAGTAQPQQDQPTVMKILAAQGIPNDQLGAASASVARQIGVDPTAPIDINDPQVRNVLVPALAQIKKMNLGQVQPPQPGDNQPQVPPQMAPQQPQMAPQTAPQGFQPSPAQQAAQNDPILRRLTFLAASQDKATAAAAKVRLESYLKNQESTGPMKEAAASGLSLQAYQERQGEQAAQQAGATERAKGEVKEQQDYIDNGRMAGARLGTLNTISNIVSSDKNLNLGFGSETTLKVKMALEKAGMDFGDLSGAQLIQKLNGVLASESSKSFSTRPTQFEFKTFLANNPGLALDEKGNVRMLGILSQTAKREYDLGKLARQNRDNWDNWDNVVEAYDKKNPVKDPTTGKILSSSSIIAPAGPKQGNQPASSASRQFSSPSDVRAAVASGQLKKGDTFTDANGKTRMVP